MVDLGECLVELLVSERGRGGFLELVSDPWFFQSLSCALGYDWHSSGTTTVTCAVLREALKRAEVGISLCGGKGSASRRTPAQILEACQMYGLSDSRAQELVYASRMVAKVDNNLIQDGYTLYHHCFLVSEDGSWTVVQQGMSEERGEARRYHWDPNTTSFTLEPGQDIVCPTKVPQVLDMTSRDSLEAQKACVDLACSSPLRLRRQLAEEAPRGQQTLHSWVGGRALVMPRSVNWDALRRVYEYQPQGFQELVAFPGVGPSTIRGLALLAELVYGAEASWRDPVRFSFAFGGKDGVPFPVDRKAMDEAVHVLRDALDSPRVEKRVKLRALKRLRRLAPGVTAS